LQAPFGRFFHSQVIHDSTLFPRVFFDQYWGTPLSKSISQEIS
jgi:hypothetical protein